MVDPEPQRREPIDRSLSEPPPGEASPPSPAALPGGGPSRVWARTLRVLLLLAADGLAVVAAAVLAYFLWALPVRHQRPDIYLQLLPLLPVFFLANTIWGLYPGFGIGAVETLRRLCLATSSIYLSLAAISFALKLEPVYSRMTFGIAWAGTLVLLPLARFGLLSLAQRWSWWGERCVVVGTGKLAARAIRALRAALSLGYRPVAVVGDDDDGGEVEGVAVLGGLGDFASIARMGVRVLLVADRRLRESNTLVDDLRHRFRHVIVIHDHESLPVDGLEVRNLGGVIGVEFVNQLLRRRNRFLKRTLDLVLGGALLVLLTPPGLLAALAVGLTSRGSPFYRQEREGLYGRPFRLIKLRTMYADAEDRLASHLAGDPEARRQWEARRKLRDDPRVVPGIGTLLRRFSLDELPQLWHVVRGEMSLVGPRPFPEYHLESFSPPFRELRRRVRPGLTGMWQVMVRSEGGIAEQEAYDAYYIRNWSLWLDLYVLGKTLAAVIHGRGAF
ncbi:MAG: exopolysaccharide biosynthesis polyprenyl glycosylphosphotransferase [Acidobacteriota bacterium]|nr:exopolysaccharide biosynthesis polyprenyl glycosylphosphotransferase [Acidobacteriota bacterium]